MGILKAPISIAHLHSHFENVCTVVAGKIPQMSVFYICQRSHSCMLNIYSTNILSFLRGATGSVCSPAYLSCLALTTTWWGRWSWKTVTGPRSHWVSRLCGGPSFPNHFQTLSPAKPQHTGPKPIPDYSWIAGLWVCRHFITPLIDLCADGLSKFSAILVSRKMGRYILARREFLQPFLTGGVHN